MQQGFFTAERSRSVSREIAPGPAVSLLQGDIRCTEDDREVRLLR